MRFGTISACVTVFVMAATGAKAQDLAEDVDSLCASGAARGSSYAGAELAPYIVGEWAAIMDGTGFTRGTNEAPVAIQYDKASQGFRIQQPGAPTINLKPIASMPDDAGLSVADIRDGVVRYTVNGVEDGASFTRDVEASGLDLMTVAGCTFDDTASFWWEVRSPGGNFANGMVMFVSSDLALGFMQNSAGGSRSLVMLRP